MFAWFNSSSNGGNQVRLSLLEEITDLIKRSKRKCLVFVDSRSSFIGYSPNVQNRPNSCFILYMSDTKEKVKSAVGNAFCSLTFNPACSALFFCYDLIRELKPFIEEFYILSEAKLYEDLYVYLQKDYKTSSLCKNSDEFEELVAYKSHNKGKYADAMIKKISCVSDSAMASNALHTCLIDNEQYTMSKDGVEYTLTVQGTDNVSIIGPMDRSMFLEIRDEETARRVKAWNTRMKELRLDAIMIKPRMLEEKNISPRRGNNSSLIGLKRPWEYDPQSLGIDSAARKALDTIARIALEKDVFPIFSIILSNLDEKGVVNLEKETFKKMKNTEPYRKLIIRESYGSIFYVEDKVIYVKPAYRELTLFKYSMNISKGVLETVTPRL